MQIKLNLHPYIGKKTNAMQFCNMSWIIFVQY